MSSHPYAALQAKQALDGYDVVPMVQAEGMG